ncbi:hypothetical protein O0Q50_19350 [Priestia aryabhattai]|uniref:Uncharacterized protein n=1 Tax=Priestia aryabhattai TaxID=412384 RepID=A0AAX6NBQ3_PRIAR|nr:hypothetical protein [Priestia aryabhattai]MDU9693331.1 hypothetical protein [Priestia aryabhattai]
MKNKFLTLFGLIMTLIFTCPYFLLSFKAEGLERVPDHMDPWTIINYVEDNKYEVLKSGIPNQTLPNYEEFKDKCLPFAKKGVLVEYGGNGLPTIIKGVKPGEERPECPKKEYGYGANIVQPDSLDGEIVTGMFSCYRHSIDERGFTLGTYDVATKSGLDNPPYGTTIYAKNLENNKTLVLKKKDIGTLPTKGVVLDLRPKAFKEIGGNSNCDDWIRKGLYYHD